MAEFDSNRPTVPGARREDEPAGPVGASVGRAAAEGNDRPVSGIAQRHDLPRRQAGTMPDLSRYGTEEPGGRPDDTSGDGGDDHQGAVRSDGDRDDARPVDGTGDRSDDSDDRTGSGDPTGSGDGVHPGPADGGDAHEETTPTRMIPVTAGATPAGATSSGATSSGATAHPAAGGFDAADGPAGGGHDDAPRHPSDDDAIADASDPGPTSAGSSTPAASPSSSASRATPGTGEPSTDTASLSVRPPDEDVARRAAVRDQAVAAKPVLARFLQVVVALFFPVIVLAAAVRAVATSSFLWLEYHRPGFPADRFGFSLDDRMTYGSYALDYVLNFAPPRYLGGLVTPEGEPLFLESEVGHMADVKGVLGLAFFIALVLLVLSVLACVYLARRYKGGIRRALFAGAVLTLVGIATLAVLAVLAWQTFFTQVHALFFANGTWTFRVDDTLIRLFPEQFWTDSAITVAVLVLAATLLTLVLTWPTKARRERSMLAQDAAQARYRAALEAS